MKRKKKLKLTPLEVEYLLDLAEENKIKGDYWGVKEHFEQRQDNVINKLKEVI